MKPKTIAWRGWKSSWWADVPGSWGKTHVIREERSTRFYVTLCGRQVDKLLVFDWLFDRQAGPVDCKSCLARLDKQDTG